jgi:transcriptional regulator with XRE-family HTH domain
MKSDTDEIYERFCSLLIEKRKKSGLSQQEVADKLGRPKPTSQNASEGRVGWMSSSL